jgi:hypothetical protein
MDNHKPDLTEAQFRKIMGNLPEVDGAELLEEIKDFIGRFVVLPSEEVGDLLVLWVLHTHVIDAAYATPYLRIVSATANSGKTLLLEVLASLVCRSWYTVNPSDAVLYRKIDQRKPTLLLDEFDNYPLEDRKAALSVLNSGYKRGATVDRCADKGALETFSCYCPKAYAGLDVRQMPDTLLSRSITIRLETKLATERVEMWIAQLSEPQAEPLRERCEMWAELHVEPLVPLRPQLPPGMVNRAAEVWWILLNIADLIGGDWPARARASWAVLSTGGDETDDVDDSILLLSDIRDALGGEITISSTMLCNALNEQEESPWGSYHLDKGIGPRDLARMLRPFKIRPKDVRVGEKSLKGYHREQFENVWLRHLPEGRQGRQGRQPASVLERDVADVADVALSEPRREVD